MPGTTGSSGRRGETLAAAGICAALVAAVFAQHPGLIVADTKLGVSLDPLRFLGGATRLWQPQVGFGEVANQSYGYLFPMGPFFALGHAAGLPAWAAQRAWQSSLLVAAFLGCDHLARRLGAGTPATRLLAALAFALTPSLLSHIGPISAEAAPECLSPWVLSPLVGERALGRPRRAAASSGVALLFAGGVNASATLATLVLPGLYLAWLAARRPRRAVGRLAAWWALAVVLGVLWWALGLLAFARYSAPFTDWIESAATTTSSASLFNVLQGTSDWVGHILTGDGPQWPAEWLLLTRPFPVLASALVVAAGALGCARTRLSDREFLLSGILVGVGLVSFGHSGPGGSPFGAIERSLLDGPLVAFRNLSKFDLVLRVPLAIGVAEACALAPGRAGAGASAGAGAEQGGGEAAGSPPPGSRPAPRRPGSLRALAGVAAIGTTAAVAVGAWPVWSGQLEPPGAFRALPAWWRAAASWLAAHDRSGAWALLLPASQHPDYTWGLPTDEPFQVLATTPWAVRNAAPLGGAGSTRLLDQVDAVVRSGHGEIGLAPLLARAGVRYLVVRNDLDSGREDGTITSPLLVRASLEGSPGIRRVARFGPVVGNSSEGEVVAAGGTQIAAPAVEIYEVAGTVRRAVTYPLRGTLRVSGGPGSLLELADLGLLPEHAATVMAANPTAKGTAAAAEVPVVTDGYRRQEVNFGRAADNVSATLLPGQPWSEPRRFHDYLFGNPAGHQTTAILYGVSSVTASSAASYASAVRAFDPADGPVAAFDEVPGTAWVNGSAHAVGQWVEERFRRPVELRSVTVASPRLPGTGPAASEVEVTTQTGRAPLRLAQGGAARSLRIPAGKTSFLKVTILAVAGGGRGKAAALQVSTPGVPPAEESLLVPADADPAAGPPVLAFSAQPGADDGCVELASPRATVCAPFLVAGTEDSSGLDRTFRLARAARYRLRVLGVARGTAALEAAMPTAAAVKIRASSQLVASPADAPQTLLEDDRGGGWIASASDARPRLTLVLRRRVTLSGLELARSPRLPASSPAAVEVQGGGTSETVGVHAGLARLTRRISARVFQLSFPELAVRLDRTSHGVEALPVGFSSLRLLAPGLVQRAPPLSSSVALACGRGPEIELDGARIPTLVRGTLRSVLDASPLAIVPCDPAGSDARGAPGVLSLRAGRHHLRLEQGPTVTPVAASLLPLGRGGSRSGSGPPGSAPAGARPRRLEVLAWQPEHRALRIGPGSAAWLVVRENANAGWVATLDGRRLADGVVDGWQQAFVVPGGSGGVVRLTYSPEAGYRLGLLTGAAAALVLVGLAAVPERRRDLLATGRRSARGTLLAALGLLVSALSGGWVGLAAFTATLLVLLGAGLRAAERPSASRRRLRGRLRPGAGAAVAVSCVVAAGVLAAVLPPGGKAPPASSGIAVQALCLAAVASLAWSALEPP